MTRDERNHTGDAERFGEAPNDFLKVEAVRLRPAGGVLCLGDGEGHNSVWLSEQGHTVWTLGGDRAALDKGEALARRRGVTIHPVQADLNHYRFVADAWDGVVSLFCHLPPALRRIVHTTIPATLRPGGILILEGYGSSQVEFGAGGPPDPAMLFELDDLLSDLAGMEFLVARTVQYDSVEGTAHIGRAETVQIVARRPVTG